MIRTDYPDVVFRNDAGRSRAVIDEIVDCHRRGQPVLVGTTSIERSEHFSGLLGKRGVAHEVLNAKFHEKEAQIVAQAGQRDAVTIATNMAGRGTDIILGPGVVDLGGLHIIGTERHEARRIDNQLRGRAGRQGDPGSSRFFVALDDDLMRLFGTDNVTGVLERLGMDDDMPLEHQLLSRAIERAQKRVESRNFEIRRRVLEYDDVLNQQRELIYKQRRQLLQGEDSRAVVLRMAHGAVGRAIDAHVNPNLPPADWELASLLELLHDLYLPRGRTTVEALASFEDRRQLAAHLEDTADEVYAERESALGPQLLRDLERLILLRVVDGKWMDHLAAMDDLREGIGLRAYGQKDPLLEYKFEAFEMFEAMVRAIEDDVTRLMYHVRVEAAPASGGSGATVTVSDSNQREQSRRRLAAAQGGGADDQAGPARGGPSGGAAGGQPAKVGRNDPCPCGSGRKYKRCCGRNQR